MNEVVQDEPAGSTNAELMGQLAAIGIVKGKPFEPDERMRRILEDAAAVGTATSRALFFDPRASEEFGYYDGLGVVQHAVGRRIHVRDAAAARHRGGDQAVPRDRRPEAALPDLVLLRRHRGHARDVHAAHRHRVAVPHGRQGRRRQPLRRRADLPGDPAAGHPGGPLLVVHRSTTTRRARCSQTPQRFPRAGSQSYPTPAATANADGSTTITFGPERPDDSPEGNWIQTTEGKGWFLILRLYSPLAAVLRQELATQRDRGRRLKRPGLRPRNLERKEAPWPNQQPTPRFSTCSKT